MTLADTREKRSRGRPQVRSDHDTRHLIADAARAEFMAQGYARTSMDNVAKSAGISKKTLYRLVPTKADLFQISVVDRIEQFMLAADSEGTKGQDVAAGLERIMIEFGMLTLSSDTIAILKLVIAESDRFPELATSFYALAIDRTYEAVERYLRKNCELGSIRLDDPHEAAGMLRGMMVMEPQRAAMLRHAPAPTREEIIARARRCVQVFLQGCAKEED
ncbi:TetR/AcrR family transcriptional regulator [Methylovirgula sp. 4M-Z18]|uniref:TetR/AcrR family transcriptional regulator n=1 Tax=Methylovirgula sp. 4M-Z18 TaxID=2293567 RepID=UPI000E2F4430|nr:TetR/AcrR family transcriptional regulator [Methylovirgula sp. 4M-Z18]RFB79475.1 TetR/AcrR family transcriptional regulator [Methylovirgula sp. 4M-Z18]